MSKVTNVVMAGIGGQGVLKASDILCESAFRAGYDVKKSEIHGMSQRGGSVASDVRFGDNVLSPMVPDKEADYLVILESTQVDANVHRLREGGTLLTPETLLEGVGGFDDVDAMLKSKECPVSSRNLNVAMLGLLSTYFDIPEEAWLEAVFANLPEKVQEQNREVFAFGRKAAG